MKKNLLVKLSCLLVVITLFASFGGKPAIAQEPEPLWAAVTIAADEVVWQPQDESAGFVLAISGPGEFFWQQTFQPGERIAFRANSDGDSVIEDGTYRYELLAVSLATSDAPDASERGLVPSVQAAVQTGSFALLAGGFVSQDQVSSTDRDPGGFTPQDVVHADDTIVQSSLCVGFDCVNGESFGFNTVILKENNLRLLFNDTSSTGSFPNNDWMLVANDSANGGGNYFSIQDVTSSRTPFLVEAGAPNYSLYVEDYGRVGLGTSTPVVELHIKDSDTPSVRLEQDSSGGWTPQTWDIAGNESNFFIRDATNGSKLSFRIQPGTPSSTLSLKANGRVGIGTWDPAFPLELQTTGENAQIFVERTDGASGIFGALSGKVRFGAQTNHPVTLVVDNDTHTTFETNGDVTVNDGTLYHNSNFYSKENFAEVDPQQVLALLSELPITLWNFKSDDASIRHMGPVAQDFYRAFGLGIDGTHIAPSDTNGVAIAAIQGLNEMVQEKEAQISALEAQNVELEARLSALEQAIASGLAPQPSFVTLLPWLLCSVLLIGFVFAIGKRRAAVKQ